MTSLCLLLAVTAFAATFTEALGRKQDYQVKEKVQPKSVVFMETGDWPIHFESAPENQPTISVKVSKSSFVETGDWPIKFESTAENQPTVEVKVSR